MSRPSMVLRLVTVAVLVLLVGQASAARPGDANGDGMVDMTDYSAWFNNYGKTGATLADGDFDGNGTVDMTDYAMWFNNYGLSGAESKMCNIKVVTDGNPDYTDMDSMIRSISDNWDTTKEKAWAFFYWHHISRRQTKPMTLHGFEVVDPIRQWNDYGYAMCSTIAGIGCGTFGYMGIPVNFWDINNHTVMEVQFEDGLYHMLDSSMVALYTKCDGTGSDATKYNGPGTGSLALADVWEIGDIGPSCPLDLTGTKAHIAKFHAVYRTSNLGWLMGADTPRSLYEEGQCFRHNDMLYNRPYKTWEWGHRYVLNLRQNETYLRYSRTMGDTKDYYVPNPPPDGIDPESKNFRYHIRGNGQWVFTPPLKVTGLASDAIISVGMTIMSSGTGLQPSAVNQTGWVVYKIEGANVITSVKIEGTFKRATSGDVNTIDVSVNNGLTWTNVWANATTGTALQTVNVCDPANGNYEVLFRIGLKGQTNVTDAQLTTLKFTTITMVNGKTQPKLRYGRNTVYVDKGEQSGTVEIWPEFQFYGYRLYSVDESNVVTSGTGDINSCNLWAANGDQDAWVTFKVNTPGPMSRLVYGGKLYTRGTDGGSCNMDLLHSFDNGATWTQTYSLTKTGTPYDTVHYETVTDIPQGVKSALVKYRWNSQYAGGQTICGIGAARMEANYWPNNTIGRDLEVKFGWKERQTDYTTVDRSHIQLVKSTSLPFSYVINVGGADHPITDYLQMNVKGAAGPVTYGYSDGNDVGGTKFQDRWVTYGNIISEGKPYTSSTGSRTNWGANDTYPNGWRLTDGIVASPYAGGSEFNYGPVWTPADVKNVGPIKLTIDLGSSQSCGAFRTQMHGWPWNDAIIGQVTDIVEVWTSTNGTTFAFAGTFNFKMRWKDLPANYMWNDEETFKAPNYELILTSPVTARYVQFRVTPVRGYLAMSEIQVLDNMTYTPFDLKLAPPPGFAGGAGGGAAAKAPAAKSSSKKLVPSRSVSPVLIRKTAK